ncbi:MAG TPA: alkaline phosphatase family protein [Minicystis sp.]|nr:alkaline phosphatase family protein [Minicystis sp.]
MKRSSRGTIWSATFGARAARAAGGLGLVAAACAACAANTSGDTNVACRPIEQTTRARPAAFGGTVFTIVMENHDRTQILGDPSAAPFIAELAKQGAVAAGYHDAYVHPSEPNYIWMVAGENFGILDDADPGPSNAIDATSHVADQIEAAGLTWKAYEESMGAPCGLVSHGEYAVKHDPFAYFDDVSGWNGHDFSPSTRCREHLVDYGELEADLASGDVPDYAFITPNLVHDMHDGSVQEGDAWLSREVSKILASDAFKRGGVLFLLWDEGASSGDSPPFIVLSPNARAGFVSHADYDTSAYLKTVEAILGLEALPCAADPTTVPTMDDLFSAKLSP